MTDTCETGDTPNSSARQSDYPFYQPHVEDELMRAAQSHQTGYTVADGVGR
jgi:hypothetical protein